MKLRGGKLIAYIYKSGSIMLVSNNVSIYCIQPDAPIVGRCFRQNDYAVLHASIFYNIVTMKKTQEKSHGLGATKN